MTKPRQIECDKDEPPEVPENWFLVRLEHNEHASPNRGAYNLYVQQRALGRRALRPPVCDGESETLAGSRRLPERSRNLYLREAAIHRNLY